MQVTFWFDFLSPYSFFAWLRIRELCARNGAELVLRPTLLVALLRHGGTKGPAEIPSKRAYTWRDCARYAALHGIAFRVPDPHPFHPVGPLRAALPEVAGADQHAVVDAIFRAAWTRGANVGDEAVLAAVLADAGLDGDAIVARTRDADVKERLKQVSDEAIARGLFGVPSMTVGDELFWGNDRLDHLELHLQGRDPLVAS